MNHIEEWIKDNKLSYSQLVTFLQAAVTESRRTIAVPTEMTIRDMVKKGSVKSKYHPLTMSAIFAAATLRVPRDRLSEFLVNQLTLDGWDHIKSTLQEKGYSTGMLEQLRKDISV